jgi:hypothetical protein
MKENFPTSLLRLLRLLVQVIVLCFALPLAMLATWLFALAGVFEEPGTLEKALRDWERYARFPQAD